MKTKVSGEITWKVTKVKIYNRMFWLGFFLWIGETWYFGWNMTAQSTPERALDLISGALMIWGGIGHLAITAAREMLQDAHVSVLYKEEVCEQCNCHCHKMHIPKW